MLLEDAVYPTVSPPVGFEQLLYNVAIRLRTGVKCSRIMQDGQKSIVWKWPIIRYDIPDDIEFLNRLYYIDK
jgi:hypothetical protein